MSLQSWLYKTVRAFIGPTCKQQILVCADGPCSADVEMANPHHWTCQRHQLDESARRKPSLTSQSTDE